MGTLNISINSAWPSMRNRIESSLLIGVAATLFAAAAIGIYEASVKWGVLYGIAAIFVSCTLSAFFIDLVFRSK